MKKILLLEDNYELNDYFKECLEENYENVIIYTATKGEQAVEIFKKENCDIAILDIVVRGKINGIEVGNQINKISQKVVPIIFVSANSRLKIDIPSHAYPTIFISKDHENLEEIIFKAVDYMIDTQRSESGFIEEEEFLSYIQGGENCILIKPKGENVKYIIRLDELRYVNTQNGENYLRIHTTLKENPFLCYGALDNFMKLVIQKNWKRIVRCQRSFIINTKFLKHLSPQKRQINIYLHKYVKGFSINERFIPLGNNLVNIEKSQLIKMYFDDEFIPGSRGYLTGVEKSILES